MAHRLIVLARRAARPRGRGRAVALAGTFETRLRAGLDPLQELPDHPQVALRLLEVGHVRAVLEKDPFGARDPAMERLDQRRGAFVVAPRGDQRRDADLPQPPDHVPVLERAGDRELVRPPHRLVDLFAELRPRPLEHVRLAIEPADVAAPELLSVKACGEAGSLLPPPPPAPPPPLSHPPHHAPTPR